MVFVRKLRAARGIADDQHDAVLARTDEQVMMVWVHDWGAPRQVRQDVDARWACTELPSLGVMPVGRQRGIADQITGFRR